mgnify:CR=1 FL=1
MAALARAAVAARAHRMRTGSPWSRHNALSCFFAPILQIRTVLHSGVGPRGHPSQVRRSFAQVAHDAPPFRRGRAAVFGCKTVRICRIGAKCEGPPSSGPSLDRAARRHSPLVQKQPARLCSRHPLAAARSPPERLRHLAVARPRPSTRGAPLGRRPRPRRHAPVPRLLTAARRGHSVTARHQHTPPLVAAPRPTCPQRLRALHALATPRRYPHLRCRRLRPRLASWRRSRPQRRSSPPSARATRPIRPARPRPARPARLAPQP